MADNIGIEVPTTVKAGVALVAVAMGMTIVSNVLTQAANGTAAMAVVSVVIGAGIGAFILYKLYTGRNWMRVLLTVLAVLGTVFVLVTLGSRFAGNNWIETIAVVVQIVGLVLLWLKPSSEYFHVVKYGKPPAWKSDPIVPATPE
jgi:hypothetical protein